MAHALLGGDELHQLVGALDIGRAVLERARGRGRAREALRGGGIFLERHQIGGGCAELDAEVEDEIVDRPRFFEIAMHRLLGGPHAVLGDAAVIAGEQHRPLGERDENRIVHLELHRQLDLALRRVEPIFVPLAKWSMLLAGNYRCITKDGMRTAQEAVHSNLEESRSVYDFVFDLCVRLGASPADLVPFEKYAAAAQSLTRPASAARA